MPELKLALEFEIHPVPPYSFDLTMRNPAGWHIFTPFEIYEDGTVWTATHISTELLGLKLSSIGTLEKPVIMAGVYSRGNNTRLAEGEIKRLLSKALGADSGLKDFYSVARKDNILKHAVEHLYGMHDTFPLEIFPDAILAILLQMAPLKRSNEMMSALILNYGQLAEFDGRKVHTWPTPEAISAATPDEIAERCRVGYRAKNLVKLARMLVESDFPTTEELENMEQEKARKKLMELPGIGEYSADIINPHGGFPIDVWSAEVFSKLFFGREPENNREAVEKVKKEGLKRWGKWSWMAFFYVVQDLPNLSEKLGIKLRLT